MTFGPRVLDILHQIADRVQSTTTGSLALPLQRCLAQWISAGCIDGKALAKSPVLHMAFGALTSPPGDLLEAAEELIVEAVKRSTPPNTMDTAVMEVALAHLPNLRALLLASGHNLQKDAYRYAPTGSK